MATARGYGSPAKAESRYGDGTSEAARDLLLSWKRESRSFASLRQYGNDRLAVARSRVNRGVRAAYERSRS